MEAPTTLSDLPFECVERIFNLVDENDLSASSLVCHEFLHLANDRVQQLELWYETVPHLNFFSKLLQRLRNLKRLTLHCPTEFDLAGTLDRIANSGLDLEFLSLIPDKIWDRFDSYFPRQSLIRIASNMPNLRSINSTYLTRDDDELIALAEIFTELEVLDLSNWGGNVSEQGIEKALKKLRKLRRINLSYNEYHLSNAWLFHLLTVPC
ncbi:hypothetical protein QQ045_032484 [Rhodiola kirilowii]